MRDHTPDFKMNELSAENKILIRQTTQQLLEKLSGDGKLNANTHLEFWIEVPGVQRLRGTFRAGFLMPDSFIYISDYFQSDTHTPPALNLVRPIWMKASPSTMFGTICSMNSTTRLKYSHLREIQKRG